MLISSGESLCIKLPTRSVVLKMCCGVEVAADKRLIIVLFSSRRGLSCFEVSVGFYVSVRDF